MSWTDKLPEDIPAESSLLATICAAGNEIDAEECASVLTENDFVDPSHRAVFRALVRVLAAHEEVNALTLKAALERNLDLGRVGDYSGLLDILGAEEVGKPMVLVDLLKECTRRRALIRLGNELMVKAVDVSLPTLETIESCCRGLAGMSQAIGESGPLPVMDVTDDVVGRIFDESAGKRFGTRTGYYRFDGLTHGFEPGQLIVLAARPGVGKTSLALNWTLGFSTFASQGVGMFFSLEMSKEEVTRKLLADQARLDLREFNPRDREQVEKLSRAKAELDDRPIMIDDRSQTTVAQIRSKVERQMAKRKVGMVTVDYLQLLSSEAESRNKNEAVRVGEITRGLKLLAKDCKVPVIILSQLNRELEKRGAAARPQLSDLRDSGSIEQDADIVAFIHRKPEESNAELILAKHRNGPCGTIPMTFHGASSRYEEIDRDTEPVLAQHQPLDEWI